MKRETKILLWILPTALLAAGAVLFVAIPASAPTPEEMRNAIFSKAELQLLNTLANSTNLIRIGHIPDSRPIDFLNEESNHRDGLTWSYVALIEEKLGIRFQRVECDNWEEDLLNHRVDLVGSVQRTEERELNFGFTKPYENISIVILAQKNSQNALYLDKMDGDTLAVVTDSAIHNNLRTRQESFPEKYQYKLAPVPTTPDGLVAVSEGRVDAIVTDGAVSSYYMVKMGIDLRVAGTIPSYSWNLCFASNTNSPLPISMVGKALDKITKAEARAIDSQWPTLGKIRQVDVTIYIKTVGGILIITILATGSFVLWNRTLRKQITDHLRELGRVRQSHAQATRALDVSEERFRVLVESSNDMIWEMDRYGGYLYVSPRVREILGYTPDQLVGKSSLSLMIPEDAARKMEQLRTRKVGSTIDCEINTYLHKNGQRVILESSGMAFMDNTGELAGFRGISRDITERITYENALRHSEERFRNLVETTSDWIWEVNVDGCYTYASPQSSELLGYEPEELIEKHFTSLMPPSEARAMQTHFGRIVEKGKPMHTLVNTNIHRDGHNVMLETSAVPFYDKEWNIQGYRGIGRDITERVATEGQLAFERNLFRTFMEHAPDLIYFKDADGRFIEINTAKAEELRLPPEKIIGRTDYDFLPAEQAQQKFEDELEVMRTRKPLQKEEFATTLDGTRWYLTTKVPRYDESGKVVGTFGTSWDITYRKQAEEELRQLRALLSNTIDSMPSILVGVDAEGRVIQWNRQAVSHTNLSPAEAVGLHLRDAFPALSKEMVKVERAIRERTPQHEEHLRVEQGDRTRYNDITVFPLLSGETEGAVIRVDDVTDRVMVENSIRNIVEGVAAVGHRFFNSMVTQLGKTLNADFTYISEFVEEEHRTMRTIAVSDKGAIGSNFDYELAAEPCGRVLDGSGCLYVENVREQYPETEMFQSLEIDGYIGIPLVDSENKALGIMVAMYRKPIEQVEFATSIMQVFAGRTAAELERLQATKDLIALRNLLENIIDSMPSILVGIDAEGRVMQWNREAEQISGIDAARAHGQPLKRVFPDFGSKINHALKKFGDQGKQHHERINCSIKGEPRMVDVTIYPITAAGSDGAVIRLDDVTDRVRIEEMMVQSEKMMSVGGLAAGMAHEINNPLAGILQNLQVIHNRIMHRTERNTTAAIEAGTTLEAVQAYMKSRDLIKMLDSTSEASRRAAKIVDNMLSFSRKEESHFEPNDLAELIDRSLELASNDYNLKKRFDFRHIEIVRDFDVLEAIPCESSQIQQVVLNLLSNSAQAMADRPSNAPNPCITLRLKREHDMALIEIEDNGPGMDAETRKRVFEPFFTTKEVGHGTGLGLSVSYFIITENHGGAMHVSSAPGRGARFSIRIPFEHRMERWGLRI